MAHRGGGGGRGQLPCSYHVAALPLLTQRVDDELGMAALLHHSTLRDHGDDVSILGRQ